MVEDMIAYSFEQSIVTVFRGFLSPPAHPVLQQLFSVSSALQAAVGAAAVETVSGLVGTSVGLAAPSGEQAVSLVHVAVAEEPKKCWW